jgi:uncharacterized membrane protein YdbT with pleckstrin-like domain
VLLIGVLTRRPLYGDYDQNIGIPLVILGVLFGLHTFLSARSTRYDIYQRRIDVADGVFNRRLRSTWVYEIKDIEYQQPFFLLITRNALIRLRLENGSEMKIIGFGTSSDQKRLWEEFTNAALRERRKLRRWWV